MSEYITYSDIENLGLHYYKACSFAWTTSKMSTVATFERVYRMNNLFQGAKTIKNVFNRLELTLDIIIMPNKTP